MTLGGDTRSFARLRGPDAGPTVFLTTRRRGATVATPLRRIHAELSEDSWDGQYLGRRGRARGVRRGRPCRDLHVKDGERGFFTRGDRSDRNQFKLEITAGSATLNEDKTFSASITFRETEGTTVTTTTETDTGTYTVSGNTVTFNSPGTGSSFTGTLSGGTLTVTDEEEGVVVVLVFEK